MTVNNHFTDDDRVSRCKKYYSLKIYTKTGGWSVLRDFQVHSFDFKNTFMELHSNFGVALFIKVDVVPDPASGQDNIVQVSCQLHIWLASWMGFSLPTMSLMVLVK